VLFDLGVSSMQLDLRERGFAYAEDAPLDMRMDDTAGLTAADVLNDYPVEELARILRDYGEERFARRIAEAVVRERTKEPFTAPAAGRAAARRDPGTGPTYRRTPGQAHVPGPADRGQRRAVGAASGPPAAIEAIGVGGRVVVMSYHSLEDRITKQVFAEATRSDLPPDLPFVPAGHEPALRLVTRGAEKASAAEIGANPRAASVRLRAVERVRAGAVA
jgi:16S rRNA (cytosine1402-N4)-methyltransferase